MASKYDSTAVKVFDNEVVEVLFENQLETRLNMEQFAHADYQLSENPGMKKKIRKYAGNGNGKIVAMGEGNGSDVLGVNFSEVEYEVETYQSKASYYDEQFMDDPDAINKLVQYMREDMTNNMTDNIIGEMKKTNNIDYVNTFNFDVVSDAIAEFPDESTEDEGLFLLINRGDSSAWRKNLGTSLQYVEAFVRKGYIGTVCGVPIYWSDAVPANTAFIGTKEAITIFVKKGVNAEGERDADTRRNDMWLRKVMLVALTNENKLIKLFKGTDPRTGKTAVTEKPADWASKYNTDYYFFDHVNNTCELNTESDWDKVAGYIYE